MKRHRRAGSATVLLAGGMALMGGTALTGGAALTGGTALAADMTPARSKVLARGVALEGGPASKPVSVHGGHSLGHVELSISCVHRTQADFNKALALLHHMTYPQAREAFRRVAEADPKCAMAHWGIAMTLFQPLWPTRPGAEERRLGWAAVRRAQALGPRTEKERLFVAATEAFFFEPASDDYWLRIRRWEQAMAKAYAAFPQDSEVASFYALSVLATTPANNVSHANADRAAAILLDVLRRNPDHPGAMHYLVHANDVSGRERESLEVVRRYENIAPHNPHALHMPTHIYTRLGDWDAVIRGNLKAAEAALEHPAGDRGELVWDEFPHAIEYLVYAYLQKGEDDEAAAQLKRLRGTAHLEPTFKTAFHLSSTEARFAVERHAWSDAAMVVPRSSAGLAWDRFPWPEAVSWFARGLGAAHEGHIDEARQAAERLEALEASASAMHEDLFARQIRVLRLEARAWLAHATNDDASGVELLHQAAELEASTPKHAVTPAPTLPAFELLGDLLSEQQRPAEALAAYRRCLSLYPHRFNSLLGAARAAHASGDEALAQDFYRDLLKLANTGTRRSALEEARGSVLRRR